MSPPLTSQSPPAGLTVSSRQPTPLQLIRQIQELCRQGVSQPVETVLASHPEIAKSESLVFDLVHEEYHQRRRAGEIIDSAAFVQRFAACGLDVKEFIDGLDLLKNHRPLLTTCEDFPPLDQPFLGFQLVGELGRGTYARVYLALEPALGNRPVVLKVSRDGAAEAHTLGRLDHPHIVPVYSVHQDATSRMTAVCMPYLGTATLEEVRQALQLRQTPPQSARLLWESIQDPVAPEFHGAELKNSPAWLRRGSYVNAILRLGQQLAQALTFVHEQGIYHRDLKPSNVLITPGGRPMLLDFNLSRHKQLPDTRPAGTIVYMPPEQLAAVNPGNRSDSPVLVDEGSDLFSLGVILYELLAGANPFGPVPRQESLEQAAACWFEQQKAGFRPLREKNPRVDAAAARVIESCLAFDPKARPQNARALALALRRQLSLAGRARRWASLRVPLLVVLTSLGLAAAAVTTYVLVSKEPYSLRQLHQGRDSYRQGHYEDALQHLLRAVEADRSSVEAHFARGRTFLRLGHYESALADFQTADELAGGQDGRIKACLGYCSNLLGIHEGAIFHYGEARELNFTTAEVLNNLGYSYTVWRNPLTKPDDALDRADEFLMQALNLDNRLQPAHYNRARVDLQRALLNSQRLPRQGLADIREAIKLGPVSAPLYWDAARLACLLATREGHPDAEIFDYLNAAIDNGLDPAKLKRDHIFETLAADNRFLAVLQKEPGPNPMKEAQKLVDPIHD